MASVLVIELELVLVLGPGLERMVVVVDMEEGGVYHMGRS